MTRNEHAHNAENDLMNCKYDTTLKYNALCTKIQFTRNTIRKKVQK